MTTLPRPRQVDDPREVMALADLLTSHARLAVDAAHDIRRTWAMAETAYQAPEQHLVHEAMDYPAHRMAQTDDDTRQTVRALTTYALALEQLAHERVPLLESVAQAERALAQMGPDALTATELAESTSRRVAEFDSRADEADAICADALNRVDAAEASWADVGDRDAILAPPPWPAQPPMSGLEKGLWVAGVAAGGAVGAGALTQGTTPAVEIPKELGLAYQAYKGYSGVEKAKKLRGAEPPACPLSPVDPPAPAWGAGQNTLAGVSAFDALVTTVKSARQTRGYVKDGLHISQFHRAMMLSSTVARRRRTGTGQAGRAEVMLAKLLNAEGLPRAASKAADSSLDASKRAGQLIQDALSRNGKFTLRHKALRQKVKKQLGGLDDFDEHFQKGLERLGQSKTADRVAGLMEGRGGRIAGLAGGVRATGNGLVKAGRLAGPLVAKALGPLGLVAGAVQVYDGWVKGDRLTFAKGLGNIVAGGATTVLAVTAVAAGPITLGVIAAAGGVALGIEVWQSNPALRRNAQRRLSHVTQAARAGAREVEAGACAVKREVEDAIDRARGQAGRVMGQLGQVLR